MGKFPCHSTPNCNNNRQTFKKSLSVKHNRTNSTARFYLTVLAYEKKLTIYGHNTFQDG